MRTEDHYARALRSPNLLFKNWSTHAASDLVGASGMASADPFGRAALRFLSGDRSSATVLLRLARGKLIGRSWHGYRARLDPKAADEIATGVLTVLADPRCHRCGGRRFVTLDGAPILGPIACAECRGTGDRPRPEDPLSVWLTAEIEREASAQAASIGRKLSRG